MRYRLGRRESNTNLFVCQRVSTSAALGAPVPKSGGPASSATSAAVLPNTPGIGPAPPHPPIHDGAGLYPTSGA